MPNEPKYKEPENFTVLRMGANKRHFNVQRPLGGGIVNEAKETFVPSSLLNDILSKFPDKVQEAMKELRKIMETEI